MLPGLLFVTLAAGGTLVMEVGEQRVLDVPGGIQRCAISDASSHDLKTIGNGQLLVIAVQPTRHTLLCWGANGERHSWLLIIHEAQRPAPERREQSSGVVDLDVGRAVLLKTPDVQGCSGSDTGSYEFETWDPDHVLVRARRETRTTLRCASHRGDEYTFALQLHDAPARHDAPGLTELRVGEEAFIEAKGIESAASDDAKIVKATVEDGGISVTALGLGDTDVRVKTRAGPIVHHFEVR
jgi:hypothetical protein